MKPTPERPCGPRAVIPPWTRASTVIAFVVTVVVGCTTAPPIMPQPPPRVLQPPPLPARATARAEPLALFDTVVERTRAMHEFAEPAFASLGRDWDADVAALRTRMEAAETNAEVLRVLDALQNSLLDRHLRFSLPQPDPRWLSLPIALDAEPAPDAADGLPPHDVRGWSVFVLGADKAGGAIRAGDRVVAIDGEPIDEVMVRERFASSANQARANIRDRAQSLTRRRVALWPELEGTAVELTLQPRAGGEPYQARATWSRGQTEDRGLDVAPAMDTSCDGVPPRDYGPYALAEAGVNVCIYTADDPRYAKFPIVRHHSFMYEGGRVRPQRMVRVDHALLKRTLGKLAPRGVLLDLRDNHGGNNPHVFLDWYAPKAYDNDQVVVRLHASLAERQDDTLDRVLWSSVRAKQYRERVARGDKYWAHPFLCPDDACEQGQRFTPSNQVTTAPIALLVGPWCVSSCDSFAAVFAKSDFGPLVGEPTAAAYTVNRLPIRLATEEGPLGTFQIALSRSRFGDDGPWLEAVPLKLDAEVVWHWDNRNTYDQQLIDGAIERLRERGAAPKRRGRR